MNTKTFKNLIAAIPDDADIMIETKPNEEWTPLKSVIVGENPDDSEAISVYLNFSE